MQNRSVFLYRRHGPKKRVKQGPPRKNRGGQKGLPNSARELLPLLQPATKALAQMLAGRTQASGQLGHAQAMLGHAEKLIDERAHNRLNPGEREEFFEQLARLKLTLADAAAEAEDPEVEEQPVRPAQPPVARDRLREMALALGTPGGAGARPGGRAPVPASDAPPDAQPALQVDAPADPAEARPAADPQSAAADDTPPAPAKNPRPDLLRLSQGGDERGRSPVREGSVARSARATIRARRTLANGHAAGQDAPAARPRDERAEQMAQDQAATQKPAAPAAAARRAPAARTAVQTPATAPVSPDPAPQGAMAEPPDAVTPNAMAREAAAASAVVQQPATPDSVTPTAVAQEAAAAQAAAQDTVAQDVAEAAAPDDEASPRPAKRRRSPKQQGLPPGWIIDDEGFVVPGGD